MPLKKDSDTPLRIPRGYGILCTVKPIEGRKGRSKGETTKGDKEFAKLNKMAEGSAK